MNVNVKNVLAVANSGNATHRNLSDRLSKAIRRLLYANVVVAVGSSAFGFSSAAHADSATSSASANDDLEEIVITARRRALQTADDRKKNSETIIDSVVADTAGLLPDNSITEVLQRVSGVTMTRFGAVGDPDHFSDEGSGIQVRGMSGVAGRLNGREIFSASGGWGLSWGDVTPELMSAVDVYKASTADLIEGGVGGQIDLRTKMPFDFNGPAASGSFSLNYGDVSKKLDPSASMLFSNRWQTGLGEFGALVDVAYSKLDQKDFFVRMEPYFKEALPDGSGGYKPYYVPGGFDYGFDAAQRERIGVYVGLQWKPNDDLTLNQTMFYSRYKTDGNGMGIFVGGFSGWAGGDWGGGAAEGAHGGNGFAVDPSVSTFDKNGALISTPAIFNRDPNNFQPTGSINGSGNTDVQNNTSWTRDLTTSFEWKPAGGRLALKGGIQFVDSRWDHQGYDLFPNFTLPGSYSLDLSEKFPAIAFTSAFDASAASNYSWGAHMPSLGANIGKERAINLDGSYVLSEDGFFRSAQVGARYAKRTEDDATYYGWSNLCNGWDGCTPSTDTFATALAGDTQLQNFDNFFRGDAHLPSGILMPSFNLAGRYDPSYVRLHYAPGNNPTDPCVVNHENWRFCSSDPYREESVNSSAYVMIRFGHDSGWLPLDGNAGVRVVRIANTSSGFYTQGASTVVDLSGNSYDIPAFSEERSEGRTVTRGLPSVNLRLKPTSKLQVRAAYSITMDQPSFNDLRATGNVGTTVDRNTGLTVVTSSSGNPLLEPQTSRNLDLGVEWYPNSSSSAHLSLFRKDINDSLVYTSDVTPILIHLGDGSTTNLSGVTSGVHNSSKAQTAQGAEIGAKTFFDRLPSPWNGFGIEANYTYIDSKAPGNEYYDIDGNVHHDAPVVGLSKNSYNIQLMFEKKMFSARLAWNWRSEYLMSTNANGTDHGKDYYYFPAPHSALTDVQHLLVDLPIYSGKYGSLDFGATFRPTDNVSLSLEFNNLLNETAKTYMGGYLDAATGKHDAELVRSWFSTDRRVDLRVQYKF